MGACSSSHDQTGELKVQSLVKVQALGRQYLARRKLQKIKEDKLKTIFSKHSYRLLYIRMQVLKEQGVRATRAATL